MAILKDLYLTRKPLAGFLLIGMGWASFFAQMPVIKAQVGASDGAYGSMVLIATLGAIAGMWVTPICRRLAGTLALPASALLVAASFVWTGFAPNLLALTAALTVVSLGSGLVDILINARVSEMETEHGRHFMNLNHAMYSFMYGGTALIVGAAREAGLGPSTICLLISLAMLPLVAMMWGDDPSPEDAPKAGANFPRVLVMLVGALVFAGFLAEASSEGWSALHLERTLGGGAAQGALGPAILGITMGFGRLFGHLLSAAVAPMLLLSGACILSGLGMVMAGAAPTLAIAYAGFALGGLGMSVVAPMALALVGQMVAPEDRLTAISRASVMGYGAFFVGPPLMGIVSEYFGLRVSFYVIGVVLAFAVAVLIPMIGAQVKRLSNARPLA